MIPVTLPFRNRCLA